MNKSRLIVLGSFVFAVLGMNVVILGPSLPVLVTRLELPISQIGTMFSLLSIGYFSSGPLYAALVNRIHARLWLAAPVVLVISLVGFATATTLSGLLVSAFLLGAGQSLTQVAYMAWLGARTRGDANASATLNRVNAFYGFGSLIGPLVVSVGARMGQFSLAFWIAAGVSFALFVIGMLAPADPTLSDRRDAAPEESLSTLLRSRTFIGMIALMAIYVGIEVTLSGYLTTFASKLGGIEPWQTPFSTSLFFGGLALSRYFAGSFFKAGREVTGIFRMLAVAIGGLAICLIFSGSFGAALLSATIAGIGLGPMYATLISIGIQRFPRAPRLVSSILTACGSFGSVTMPYITGVLIDRPNDGATLAWQLLIVWLALAVLIWLGVARGMRST